MPYVAPSTKSANTVLTSTEWNTVVNDIIDLNGRIQNLTTTQRNALTPAVGDLVYDSTLKELFIWGLGGSVWSGLGNNIICTSTTRPSTPVHGQVIYETNTNKTFRYDGIALSQWIEISSGYPAYSNSQINTVTSTYPPSFGSVIHDTTFQLDRRYVATGVGNLYMPTGNLLAGTFNQRPTPPTLGTLYLEAENNDLLKYVSDIDGSTRWMQVDNDYRRNLVINGGFDFWQRGGTFNPISAITTTGQNYGADRWQFLQATSNANGFTQGTAFAGGADPVGFNFFLRVQRQNLAVFTTPFTIQTSFETRNIRTINGKRLTLSFWARAGANYSATTSFLTSNITTGTGTDNTVGNFTGTATVATTNHQLTTTWKRFSITTSSLGFTEKQLGISFVFTPTGTAGAADYFDITGVQLETGAAASDFENRDYAIELQRCQRYYYKTGLFPSGLHSFGTGYANGTQQSVTEIRFPITLRTAPTALQTTGTAADYSIRFAPSANVACNAPPTFSTATTDAAIVSGTIPTTSLVQGQAVMLSNNSSLNSFLAFSAEL